MIANPLISGTALVKEIDCFIVLLTKRQKIWFISSCHKLHSACISTTSGPIFTNQVALESPKWGLSADMWDAQRQQQMTEISGYQ